jgi:hypothetical protein
MRLHLEEWEVNMVLTALAELPYEESAATICRIKEQIEPPVHCSDCAERTDMPFLLPRLRRWFMG